MILLFTYDDYYPIGGADDLEFVADNLEDVVARLKEKPYLSGQNAHAFDTNSLTFVGHWTKDWGEDDPWEPAEDWRTEGGYRKGIEDLRKSQSDG